MNGLPGRTTDHFSIWIFQQFIKQNIPVPHHKRNIINIKRI